MKKNESLVGPQEFGERLHAALHRVGLDYSPTRFARRFNARAGECSVTAHGARKWLMGETIPSQARMEILARWLCVTPQWLRFNLGAIDDLGSVLESIPDADRRLLQDISVLHGRSQLLIHQLVSLLADPNRFAGEGS